MHADMDKLIEVAKIQSTEASNAIEGIVTSNQRLAQLMEEKTTPRNRDEKEIKGYRYALNLVHESFDYIPIRPNYILQLHKEMYQFLDVSYGGSFKDTPNEIAATYPDGRKVTIFKPLEPYETPDAIQRICEEYDRAINQFNVDPLLVIPVFIHDFLCVHPFNDGNGRMSRLLTTLLLYKSGYVVGRYISLEKKIQIAGYLRKLHYISCRESYAKKIIEKHTDLEITHVMDPVFLPDREDYLRFIKKEKPAQKYIFIYLPVGLNKTLLREAITYAKENNFEVLEYTSSIHLFSGHKTKYSPGIEDFLSAIYYSERVFTNSFHSICFSLLFEKEFYAFTRKYSGKVVDICKTMGLEDHYFPDDRFVEPKAIDYKHVNNIISKYRELSRKWITDAIDA